MDQIPLSTPSSMHAHINDALHIPASGCSIIIPIHAARFSYQSYLVGFRQQKCFLG